MDETDQPEHKAEICEQLYHEVPALLEFYSGVVATLSGSGQEFETVFNGFVPFRSLLSQNVLVDVNA
jgi:hypothetical protein